MAELVAMVAVKAVEAVAKLVAVKAFAELVAGVGVVGGVLVGGVHGAHVGVEVIHDHLGVQGILGQYILTPYTT